MPQRLATTPGGSGNPYAQESFTTTSTHTQHIYYHDTNRKNTTHTSLQALRVYTLGRGRRPRPVQLSQRRADGALEALCQNVLEPLRHRFGPIVISSGFRSPAVNRLIPGAAPASQHTKGEAADIVVGTPERAMALYRFIRDRLDFDQLIWEPIDAPVPRWIHVSYTRRRKNRHSVL